MGGVDSVHGGGELWGQAHGEGEASAGPGEDVRDHEPGGPERCSLACKMMKSSRRELVMMIMSVMMIRGRGGGGGGHCLCVSVHL